MTSEVSYKGVSRNCRCDVYVSGGNPYVNGHFSWKIRRCAVATGSGQGVVRRELAEGDAAVERVGDIKG